MLSCTKNITVNDEPQALSAETGSNDETAIVLNRTTKFGSLISGDFTIDERVSIAKSLNVAYVRDALMMSTWDGYYKPYETYTSNGINVILNVNYDQPTQQPDPFPTDMKAYKKTFKDIVQTYQPEVIVVENEEINERYHSGPMTDYIKMLQVAISVCHPKKIKVTNGGIYGSQLEICTYRYLQTISQARADEFGNSCMSPFQVKAAQEPGSNPTLEYTVSQMDTLLDFYKNLDYVNVHLYEPFGADISKTYKVSTITPGVVEDIQEFLLARTGKPTMTNETGQRDNTNPFLVTAMLSEYDRLKFPYAIWYSGEGGSGAQPLYNISSGVLALNGLAFAGFMAAY